MFHAIHHFCANSSALAFPNGLFHGYTNANANVYVLPQNEGALDRHLLNSQIIILRVSFRNLLLRAACVVVPLDLAMSSFLVFLFLLE